MIVGLACGLAAIGGFAGLGAQAPSALRNPPATVRPLASAITATSTTPTTISFTLSDPDAAAATGTGTVHWTITGGSAARTWNVAVSVAPSSFIGCTEVPVTAATAQCTTVTGGTAGVCNSSAVTLGATATQVASGTEATGTALYSVGLTYSISDAWKYKGHTTACTLTVTYKITAN